MIIEFFPNPNKSVSKLFPVTNYGVVPHITPKPKEPTSYTTGVGISEDLYVFWAGKKNISVEEFKRRDVIVRDMANKCAYMRGDTVYPYSLKEYEDKGKCFVKGLYRTYAEMENDSEWPANDMPFIVTAHPMMRPQETFFATGGFFKRIIPTS